MASWLTDEILIRQGVFLGVLGTMLLLEWLIPKRPSSLPKWRRDASNLSISLINSLALRFLLPLLAVDAALLAEEKGWGLFNLPGAGNLIPGPLVFALSLLLLDLAIYAQHVVFHLVPALWRLHAMHHVDRDIDTTTGIRFHPLEILLSMGFKIALVFTLGIGPIAVIAFEVILNATAMFNHANIALPRTADRVLRALIVTPDMHRVHHSVIRRETDSNFGFNLSLWDRLFGTYRAEPEKGHQGMEIGLAEHRGPEPARILWSLALPFRPKFWKTR